MANCCLKVHNAHLVNISNFGIRLNISSTNHAKSRFLVIQFVRSFHIFSTGKQSCLLSSVLKIALLPGLCWELEVVHYCRTQDYQTSLLFVLLSGRSKLKTLNKGKSFKFYELFCAFYTLRKEHSLLTSCVMVVYEMFIQNFLSKA